MPSPLPFSLLLQPPLVGSQNSDVCIAAADDASADELSDLLEALCVLADLGCFATTDARHAGHAGVAILPGAVLAEGTWRGTVQGVADLDAFWRLFLGLCAQYHLVVAPLTRVTLSARASAPLLAPWPAPPRQTPFALERAEPSPGSPLVVRLDSDTWDPVRFDEARLALEDWASVVYAGGFHPTNQPMTDLPFDDLDIHRVGRHRLECVLPGWRGDNPAVDLVLRLCVGLHWRVGPLRAMEIE